MGEGRLTDRVAVVTGAAHGIGRAICVELAREGASVWACDVLAHELDETRRATVRIASGSCRTAIVDATDSARVASFVGEVLAADGRVDVLVNTAGGVAGQSMRPIETVTDADWHRIFAINLDAAFRFTRAVVSSMKKRRRGSIVNISSGAGRSYSLTGIQAYASAKAGILGLTRSLAKELGPKIMINAICPGVIETELGNSLTRSRGEEMKKGIMLNRLGTGSHSSFLSRTSQGWALIGTPTRSSGAS